MNVQLNMQGYFTRNFNLDACPRKGDAITYTGTHGDQPVTLRGIVQRVEHFVRDDYHVIAVACSAMKVE